MGDGKFRECLLKGIGVFYLITVLFPVQVHMQGGDTCLSAVEISVTGVDQGNTSLLEHSGGPGPYSSPDAWYFIDIPEGETHWVNICVSSPSDPCWDTYLGLYENNCTTLKASSDDESECSSGRCPGDWGGVSGTCQSHITNAELGPGPATYYICVEGYWSSSHGEYCLELTDQCDCSGADTVTCGTYLLNENNSSGLPGKDCWNEYTDVIPGGDCDIWYETGPETLYFYSNLTGEDQFVDFYIDISDSSDLDMFALIKCSNEASDCAVTTTSTEAMYHYADNGIGYYIAVDGYNGAETNYDFEVVCTTYCEYYDVATTINCGDSLINQTTVQEDPYYPPYNFWGDYGCPSSPDLFGHEKIYELDFTEAGGSFTASLSNAANHDIVVLEELCDNDAACVAYGDDNVTVDSAQSGTYYIVVDSPLGLEGTFDLDLTCSAAPPTGTATATPQNPLDCSSAVPINCGTIYNGTTVGAPQNVYYYNCVGYEEEGPEVVHALTVSPANNVTITLNPTGDIDLDLFLLSTCDADSCIYFSAGYGDESIFISGASGLYYVVVDGYHGDEGSYTLSVTCGNTPTPTGTDTPFVTVTPTPDITDTPVPTFTPIPSSTPIYTSTPLPSPPPEQPLDCLSAQELSCGIIFFSNTSVGDTNARFYNCSSRDEWGPENVFSIEIDHPQWLHASMAPSSGNDLDFFLLSSCDQDNCLAASTNPTGPESIDYQILDTGTYYLVVDGYEGAAGGFSIIFDCASTPTPVPTATPIPQLDCSGAIQVFVGQFYNGNTSTMGSSEIDTYSCAPLQESGNEVVYSVNLPPGEYEVSLTFTNPTDLDLFMLNSCNQNDCIYYSANGTNAESIILSEATSAFYYIVVDSYRNLEGDYTLTVQNLTKLPAAGPIGYFIIVLFLSGLIGRTIFNRNHSK